LANHPDGLQAANADSEKWQAIICAAAAALSQYGRVWLDNPQIKSRHK